MTEALITPDLLQWARIRAGFSREDIALKVNIKVEEFTFWETGVSAPTFDKAQELARVLRIPFGYLFLSSPPREEMPLPDLRTISSPSPHDLSVDFRDLLNDVLLKQQWYRDFLVEENVETLGFVGRYNTEHRVETVARDIAKNIGIDENLRNSATNWEDFLRSFVRNAENAGVLVMRNSVVGNNTHRPLSLEEFRGFVISDNIAPLVFINSRDAKAAQIFTLAHELAHLWIGQSGILNPDWGSSTPGEPKDIEQFCNHVAAELLVPAVRFKADWKEHESVESNIDRLKRRYRVSSLVIIRRAHDLGRIGFPQYVFLYEKHLTQFKEREAQGKGTGGGDFYATLFARNSHRLTRAVVTSAFEGRIAFREAARLLGIKINTLNGVADRINAG